MSYTVWGLMIPAVLYMIYRALRNNKAAIFSLLWFACTFLIWIPAVMITHRVTYPYYIYPAIGAICIGIAMGLSNLLELGQTKWSGKWKGVMIGVVAAYCVAHLAVFVYMSPVFTRW